jgi:hypothetical protein
VRRLTAHRNKNNKVGDAHYSFGNWEMYCRKIPLLQVIKYMPKSIELQNALTVDQAHEEGKNATLDGDFVTVTDDDLPQGQDEGAGQQQQRQAARPAAVPDRPAKGEPADRQVKLADGTVLFSSHSAPESGMPLKFKGAEYIVKSWNDDDVVVEPKAGGAAPAAEPKTAPKPPAATPAKKIEAVIAKALATKDSETADLQLDEARSLIAELLPADRGALEEALGKAIEEIQSRRANLK